MSRSSRETLPVVREWWEVLSDVRQWSRVYPKSPGVVGRPTQLSVSGGKPFWMSGSGRECIPNVWEWLGDPPDFL